MRYKDLLHDCGHTGANEYNYRSINAFTKLYNECIAINLL